MPRLSQTLQKQLATDIEQAGGIESFVGSDHKLSRLLDNNPTLYGRRGNSVRATISKKVYKWQELQRNGKYSEIVLNKFGVTSFRNHQHQQRYSDDSDDDSSNAPSVGSPVNSVITLENLSIHDTPTQAPPVTKPKQAKMSSSPAQAPSPFPAAATASPKQTARSLPPNTTVLKVNLACPEDNGPFTVFPIKDIPGLDQISWYYGFGIVALIDVRYLIDTDQDVYKAQIWTPNSVLMSVPSWLYSLLNNRALLENAMDECLLDGLDDALHKYHQPEQQEKRKEKHFLLQFEKDVILSSKETYQCDDERELEAQAIPLTYVHPRFPGNPNSQHLIAWTAARIDSMFPPYKRGAVRQKTGRLQAAFGIASPYQQAAAPPPPPPPPPSQQPQPQQFPQQQQYPQQPQYPQGTGGIHPDGTQSMQT